MQSSSRMIAIWSPSKNAASSPVSKLSVSLQKLECHDKLAHHCSTPRRRLILTPEMETPPPAPGPNQKGAPCELETPTGDPQEESNIKRVRLRLSSILSTAASDHDSSKENRRHDQTSPAGGASFPGETETLEPMALVSLRRMVSGRKTQCHHVPESAIQDQSLIGDFSKQHLLPVERVGRQNLQYVSSQTVAALISGRFGTAVEDYLIIDCRYPYEYQGGHIKGAVNLHTEAQIHRALLQNPALPQLSPTSAQPDLSPQQENSGPRAEALTTRGSSGSPQTPSRQRETLEGAASPRKIILFHCEFSSKRGPHLYQYLRALDRRLNVNVYPQLLYPELYLLQGGYKQFYACFPELCEPRGYVPMRHRGYREQLRGFRRRRRSRLCRRRPLRPHQKMNG
ncbi:cell division cycle 25 homolog d [Chanos chanos]|uniref:M-phase inducer phosphatase n=1 Tax=Chanos chanos TaxID=29144 RepID=A0A6J2VU79_CHACN|nr:M-phase inducer phosphatase 1-B-like [Chanos chanos]